MTKEAATAEAETDVAATEEDMAETEDMDVTEKTTETDVAEVIGEDMAETEEIVAAVTEEEAKEFAITSGILEAASSVMTVVLVM